MKQFNLMNEFKKLKVNAIVGSYAIVVDQTDQFVGIIKAESVKNKKEFFGNLNPTPVKIKCVTQGSYRHSMIVKVASQCCSTNNLCWGVENDGDTVIIEHFEATEINNPCIAANFSGFKEIPQIEIINENN